MDTRQLIESLVSSLAWPVAVVVIALLARPLLLRWLRPRPPASDASSGIEESSAAFNAYLWQASAEMVEAGIVGPANATDADVHKDEIDALMALSASSTIIEGHMRIHRALQNLVLRPNDGSRGGGSVEANTMALARGAHSQQLIDAPMLTAIEKLTYLRGLSTSRGGGEVNPLAAMDYLTRVQAVVYRLEHRPSRDDDRDLL
ncbi:MAG: hypothetical protein ACYCST_13115 [Acidimicrobiales bacterium]